MEQRTVRRSAFRWQGLLAFIIILVLLVAFSLLLLNSILKWTMEYNLGQLNGAEVNIAEVDHHWSPLGLELTGVELTDPAAPMQNRVVVGRLSATVNVEQLLLGRIHLEEVVSTGIRVAQPRRSAGEVYQLPSADSVANELRQQFANFELNLPSTDEVMSRLQLQTPAAIAKAREQLEAQQTKLAEAKQALPTEEKIKSYEQQVKAITEADYSNPAALARAQQEFEKLKQQFEQDRAAVLAFKEVASESADTIKALFAEVRTAPARDLERAKQLMQLNSEGLSEITAVIFGEQVQQWSQYILLAYEQLAPMLARSADVEPVADERAQGDWVEFAAASAPPSFLIKHAVTEFVFGETQVEVDWQNITHQHAQLGQPTTFRARGENSNLWRVLNLNGELALTADGVDARQQWQVQGIQLQQLALAESQQFAATILSTLLDSEGSVALRDSQLSGGGTVRLADLAMQASAENKWANVVAQALQKLTHLDIQTDVSGAMTAPVFALHSDLDRQLGSALQSAALDQAETQLQGIRADLQAQANGFLGDSEQDFNEILALVTDAENREQRLQSLLKAKLEAQLEDKLKDKLKGFLGGG